MLVVCSKHQWDVDTFGAVSKTILAFCTGDAFVRNHFLADIMKGLRFVFVEGFQFIEDFDLFSHLCLKE